MTSPHRHRWANNGPAVTRRRALAGLAALTGLLVLGAGPEAAEPGVITAEQAKARVALGDLVLIDVRSPREWIETGIAPGAKTVTIHDPGGLRGFVAAVTAAVGGKKDREIALVCAQGIRSTFAQRALTGAGFTRVLNLKEGMLGGPHGRGWIPRGLPVVPCRGC